MLDRSYIIQGVPTDSGSVNFSGKEPRTSLNATFGKQSPLVLVSFLTSREDGRLRCLNIITPTVV